eukprot:scpid23409/ scgid0853/ Serine/threonine-protein kinase D3; Protein kinase C nu type; Protein kinase EPK2; nPKC-nu
MALEAMDDVSTLSGITLTFQCGLYRDKQMLVPTTMQSLRQQALVFLARKYPDHPYINLSASLSYSILSADGASPDRLIASVKDLYEDCVVNISLTNRAQTSRQVINPHRLSVKSYKSPAFCDYCGQMLFGLVRQGLQCEGCGYNFHKRCAYRIPNNCPGVKRQPKTPRRFSKHRSDKSESSLHVASISHSCTLPSQASVDSVMSLPANHRRNSLPRQPRSFDHESLQSAPVGPATSPSHGHGKPPKRSNSWFGRPVWIDREIASRRDCEVEVPHTFVLHNYKRPTICMLCRRLLIGLIRQGMQCKDCKYNVHRHCANRVPKDCQSHILDELQSRGQSEMGPGVLVGDAENGSSPCHEHALDELMDHDDHHPAAEGNGNAENSEGNSVHSVAVRRHSHDSELSANIPLQRVYVSVPKNGSSRHSTIKEGWMVCFSTLKKVRELYYWKLDSRHLYMLHSPDEADVAHEIPLSNMLVISVPTKAEPISPNTTAHCFEIKIQREGVYYIGEKGAPEKSSIHSNKNYVFPEDCGVSMKDALAQAVGEKRCKPWEEAIRGAFMPVTPKPSIKTVVSVTESTSIVDNDEFTGHVEPGPPGEPAPMFRQYKSSTLDICDFYQIFSDECLGSGQFGVVYAGVHRKSARPVAIKVIDKLRFPSKQETALKNEVAILHTLKHNGVVNLERMFETPDRVFVVMEKMEGDMLEMILRHPNGRLEERTTRFLIFQILNALQHLHSKNIVHCDLKPENVLLRGKSSFPQIKLCDFGFARIIGEKSFRKSVVGTPAYLAPEVLNNDGYDRSLDMWSVGVIIYVSLSGTFPFNEDEEIAEQIQNADFMYPNDPWEQISRDASGLINLLLQVNKSRRCTARQALLHPFLTSPNTWQDLRQLEMDIGERYLTHPSEDKFMQQEAAKLAAAAAAAATAQVTVPAAPCGDKTLVAGFQAPVVMQNGVSKEAMASMATVALPTDRVTTTIEESAELAGRHRERSVPTDLPHVLPAETTVAVPAACAAIVTTPANGAAAAATAPGAGVGATVQLLPVQLLQSPVASSSSGSPVNGISGLVVCAKNLQYVQLGAHKPPPDAQALQGNNSQCEYAQGLGRTRQEQGNSLPCTYLSSPLLASTAPLNGHTQYSHAVCDPSCTQAAKQAAEQAASRTDRKTTVQGDSVNGSMEGQYCMEQHSAVHHQENHASRNNGLSREEDKGTCSYQDENIDATSGTSTPPSRAYWNSQV